MLKELYEKIQETALPKIVEVGDRKYAVAADGYMELDSNPLCPDTLELQSLDAMVKLVRTEGVKEAVGPLYITVPTHRSVLCFGQPGEDNLRRTYYMAKATDVPGWDDTAEFGFEAAQIALRTRVQETPDTEYVLKLLSDISLGAKVTFNDNGVATTVVTQKGVALQSNTQIRPLVTLRPYRTFQEVDQPGSLFLIRVGERGIKFIAADGGMWKLKARQTAKEYLEKALAAEIEAGKVYVAL